MRLSEVKTNKKCKVVKVDFVNEGRLYDIGLKENAEIEVVQVSPLKSPIKIRLRGGFIAIRKELADKIVVEYV